MLVVYVSKAVLPILRQHGSGHIFQISSVGGRRGVPGLWAYQSAKWVLGGFSTVLAREVAPLGINVIVVEPGGMKTDSAGSSMKISQVSKPYESTVGYGRYASEEFRKGTIHIKQGCKHYYWVVE
ncbi:hypothetical protein BDV39DRAFT_198845 [Aspergillus sergii]|uniref:NAD(P)-binding protein n=1 Tax=Aspergillus sergii TaxID=1034303 RepID=A0A5N6XKY0_9EURO|nr:hypothetical protein BDV39DRAFT_198845 [Aspergillus sergii]